MKTKITYLPLPSGATYVEHFADVDDVEVLPDGSLQVVQQTEGRVTLYAARSWRKAESEV